MLGFEQVYESDVCPHSVASGVAFVLHLIQQINQMTKLIGLRAWGIENLSKAFNGCAKKSITLLSSTVGGDSTKEYFWSGSSEVSGTTARGSVAVVGCPFMLRIQNGEARLTLWPTATSEPLGKGVEPFLKDGQRNERIRKTISFLTGIKEEIGKARPPLSLLEANSTLLPRVPKGLDAPLVLGGAAVRVVKGEMFAALGDAEFLRLRENGALSWIYAHLQSLHCAQALAVKPAEAASTVDLAWQKGRRRLKFPYRREN